MSDIAFALVNADGTIASIGSCPEDHLDSQSTEDMTAIASPPEVTDPARWVYADGTFSPVTPPQVSLGAARDFYYAKIKATLDATLAEGVYTPDGIFPADDSSMIRFNLLYSLAAAANSTLNTDIVFKDGSVKNYPDYVSFLNFASFVVSAVTSQQLTLSSQREYINGITSVTDLATHYGSSLGYPPGYVSP